MKRATDLRASIGDRLDRKITDSLRPVFSDHPDGFVTATAHEAATAGGGDILIDHKLDHGHLVILADIMGHGEQAKFFAHAFAGYAYGAMRALGRHTSPNVLLRELSDLFLSDPLLKNSLATALVLMLYPNGEISIASAGHPPPFLIKDMEIEELEIGGPMLGLMDDPVFNVAHLRISNHQRLVLYTDGISEAGRTLILSPRDLILQPISKIKDFSDQRLANGLLERAQERSNYILLDDATVVVIRKTNEYE